MSNENISLMSELRVQAMGEPRYLLRNVLRETADLLDAAIDEFAESPNWATLKTVNGLWARGWRSLEKSRGMNGDAA